MSSTDHGAEAVGPRNVALKSAPTGDDTGSPAFKVRTSKLRPSAPRAGVVRRSALLERMERSDASVLTVVAPAGYGKTTLLAQWSEHGTYPVAWLSIDDADNDPAALCTGIATALDRVGPVGSDVFGAVAAQRNPASLG